MSNLSRAICITVFFVASASTAIAETADKFIVGVSGLRLNHAIADRSLSLTTVVYSPDDPGHYDGTLWRLIPVDGGRYLIKGATSGLYMDHTAAARKLTLSVVPYDPTRPQAGHDGTLWEVIRAPNGSCFIRGAVTGLYVNHSMASKTLHLETERWDPSTGDFDGTLWELKDSGALAAREIVGIRHPIVVSRGSSTWTIRTDGTISSDIRYTVGSGSGSKHYACLLVIEFADGSGEKRFATKTVGRPEIGTERGNAVNHAHQPIPAERVRDIRNAYVIHSEPSSSGPGTLVEWADKMIEWFKEGDRIYREAKEAYEESEIGSDAVIFSTQ